MATMTTTIDVATLANAQAQEQQLRQQAGELRLHGLLDRWSQVMADPERMLAEQVQEELGISESATSPLREAWITGSATAIGALIPVLPFFLFAGPTAVVVSFAISMLSHWLVGAARSVFTGRGVFRSGLDMFVVGLGVAVAGYYVGEWVGRLL
jgi:VIT1/CCC1 family predicted Fe2+/Mn2+ transporter